MMVTDKLPPQNVVPLFTRTCPRCDGKKKIRLRDGFFELTILCPACDGSGRVPGP